MAKNTIFRSFTPLTPAQRRHNMLYVAAWGALVAFVGVAVTVAVKTGIVWTGAIGGGVGLLGWIYILGKKKLEYTSPFSLQYNIMRSAIVGAVLFPVTAWRVVLSAYNRLIVNGGLVMTMTTFATILLVSALAVTLLCALGLRRTENADKADVLGIVEAISGAITIGAAMSLILYA